jgi:hypothetical protein
VRTALALAAMSALALAACAGGGGPQRPNKQQIAMIDRALTSAPGAAQPSRIVAAEVALGQAGAELTPALAFANTAASGAQVQEAGGLTPFANWLPRAPASGIKWNTRAVVISCDGTLAASTGRFTDAGGIVGNYAMIWQRQSDGTYRWLHHVAAPDMPQPPPPARPEAGNIVVRALDAVQGMVATCPRQREELPPPPALAIGDDLPGAASLSRDGTLRWRWQQRSDGVRVVAAEYFYEGRWLSGFEQPIGAGASAGAP